MATKVILDVDPGVDDALAVCLALFDPRVEVLAVTAVGGNVSPEQATVNAQSIIEQLDPPRWPRLSQATPPEIGLPVTGRFLYAHDVLGKSPFEVAERQHLLPSEKVICDQVRAFPHEVTIIALGPLTNIARAFVRDPELPSLVGRIVMAGGTMHGPGNITPAAEFNMYCDPVAAQAVFRSPSTKTLVPLDVTNKVTLTFDLLNRLPSETMRVGRFLHDILPSAFRAYRQQFGLEGIHVHDTVTLLTAINPDLMSARGMAGDVETMGELTSGMTVFDRRRTPTWKHNMEVAVDVQVEAVVDELLRGLSHAAETAG